MDLVPNPNTAVGMHSDHMVQILTGLAEPTEMGRIKEPHPKPNLLNKWVELEHVEHILVVFSWKTLSALVPKFVELDGSVVGPGVTEATVGRVVPVGGVEPIVVARELEVNVWVKPFEWVPQPHYVSILHACNNITLA
ncbi:type IV secretion system protein VirB11 [Striga asiatica]|uniref:Type IV secretion system protein VirB11 n=1 Tax=Striga asiatica TaxID=4170 RepID=A0A5A7Q3T1_STRAF|nr:type IV secretion system protein VirB11 [Striga asiatica]